jgi:hypothetical protein
MKTSYQISAKTNCTFLSKIRSRHGKIKKAVSSLTARELLSIQIVNLVGLLGDAAPVDRHKCDGALLPVNV